MLQITPCLLFALALTGKPEAVRQISPPPWPPRLTLAWMDHYGLLRFGFQSMADEVKEIFRAVGVEVVFKKGVLSEDNASLEIVISVRPFAPVGWNLGEHVMGAVPMGEQPKGVRRRRVVYIFLSNVIKTLALEHKPTRLPTATETGVLAQALARIVSHEVVHAIAPDAPHSYSGLMQLQLTRKDLLKPHLRLSSRSAKAFHSGLQAAYLNEVNTTRTTNSTNP
jgi:hypothetical protein